MWPLCWRRRLLWGRRPWFSKRETILRCLKDAVTTPAGCTIDGIMELEEGKLRVTLIKAVVKAAQRAKELAYG